MRNKIIVTIVIGLAIAGLVALAWWWFFSRPNPTLTQTTGTFGSAQNASTTPITTTPQTNIATPVGISTQPAKNTLPAGSYQVKSPTGQTVGTYQFGLAGNATGAGDVYSINSTSGSAPLDPGTYSLTVGGVAGDYVVGTYAGDTALYTVDALATTTDLGTGTLASTTSLGAIDLGTTNTPAVDFLNSTGDGGSITSNAGTVFNPTATNQIVNPTATGGILPNITGGTSASSNNGLGIAGALAGAAVAGGISCGGAEAFAWLSKTLFSGTEAAPSAAAQIAGAGAVVGITTARSPVSVQTIDLGPTTALNFGTNTILTNISRALGAQEGDTKATNTTNTFWGCLARTIAKVALQQITSSVVNWINSGFNGSPSFVTSPEQFFTNVADNAAGQFIKGSALSFLCSPFSLQIKLAIAQSYANRGAQSCSLTSIVNNVNGFMNGSFTNGGWAGLISFTSVPTNNPYGAFASASIGINSATANAVLSKQREQGLGNGFLDFVKKQDCVADVNPTTAPQSSASQEVTLRQTAGSVDPNQQGVALGQNVYEVCKLVHTTPGHVISDALGATNNSVFTELDVAKSFDEVISALITQLVTRTLQGGLSNLSGTSGYQSSFYTADQLAAQTAAQALVTQLQGDTQTAQNYGGIEQGSISDIQNAQSQLNDLFNCFSNAAAASSTSGLGVASATNAGIASSTITQLEAQISGLNNEITRSNNAITLLVQFESTALSAGSQADIDTVTTQYTSAHAQGQLITATDLTTAQQNRTTLQSQLAALNQQTSTNLAQCNAGQ